MGKGEISSAQPWLPGLEPALDPRHGRPVLRRTLRRSKPPRPPSIDKLVSSTPTRVRKLFSSLRSELLSSAPDMAEAVAYDDLAGAFAPSYSRGREELLRLTLDPVLAATMTLDRGDRQLGAILASPRISEKLRADTLRSARRSGRRIFVALLVRNSEEMAALLWLVRERVALDAR